MDIQEVKSRQEALAMTICTLINQFEEACGVSVKSVDLMHETTIGGPPTVAYATIRVELS